MGSTRIQFVYFNFITFVFWYAASIRLTVDLDYDDANCHDDDGLRAYGVAAANVDHAY